MQSTKYTHAVVQQNLFPAFTEHVQGLVVLKNSGQRSDPGNTAASISRALHIMEICGLSEVITDFLILSIFKAKYRCDIRNHELARNTDDASFF